MSKSNVPWSVVWLTGASSGIGRDIALKLADLGATVAASARSEDALNALAKINPNIIPVPVDVTDRNAMERAVQHIQSTIGTIDLAIMNAGVWEQFGARKFSAEKANKSMDVNYGGVVNGIGPLLPDMIKRQSGHVAFVSSVAGYRGLPNAAAYAPSKAAVISLSETLQPDLARFGVKVSIINPGFVDTPMTEVNKFPMPFIITSQDAADRIITGLKKGKYQIAFPWQTNLMMKFARLMPTRLFLRMVQTFMLAEPKPSKEAD